MDMVLTMYTTSPQNCVNIEWYKHYDTATRSSNEHPLFFVLQNRPDWTFFGSSLPGLRLSQLIVNVSGLTRSKHANSDMLRLGIRLLTPADKQTDLSTAIHRTGDAQRSKQTSRTEFRSRPDQVKRSLITSDDAPSPSCVLPTST
jgi:hypothetical protein